MKIFSRPAISLRHAILVLGIVATGTVSSAEINVKLSGDQEVPPVQTQASGSGTIKINDDKSVSGSVSTTGMKPTAAHIHEAAPGKNGPVAIPLEKASDHEFMVPAGTKLNDAQFKAFRSGNLYVNVHSDAHKNGEIRAQLKP
jgi:hypothetical protein